MRTNDEILARVESIKDRDWLGFETGDLIVRLPFDIAKPYLKEGVTENQWDVDPRDKDSLINEMRDYMPFAWEKANNCRGISASRSMSHYSAWVWLAGDDLGDLHDYDYYGKDNLVMICKHYGFDYDQLDDGIRTNTDE